MSVEAILSTYTHSLSLSLSLTHTEAPAHTSIPTTQKLNLYTKRASNRDW